MPITYKVAKCRNPKNPDVDYFKGTAVKNSDYDFEDLVEDVALATTVTKGDAMAVLASIKPYIQAALLAGRRVVLNDLGSFVIGIRSKCFSENAMNADDFSPSAKIKGYHLNFRPEVALKKALDQKVSFKRIGDPL